MHDCWFRDVVERFPNQVDVNRAFGEDRFDPLDRGNAADRLEAVNPLRQDHESLGKVRCREEVLEGILEAAGGVDRLREPARDV